MSLSKSMRRGAAASGGLAVADYYNASYPASTLSSTTKTVTDADFNYGGAPGAVYGVVFIAATTSLTQLSSVTIGGASTSLSQVGDIAMARSTATLAQGLHDIVLTYSASVTILAEAHACVLPPELATSAAAGGDGSQTSVNLTFTAGLNNTFSRGVAFAQDDTGTPPDMVDVGGSWTYVKKVHEGATGNNSLWEFGTSSAAVDGFSATGGSGLYAAGTAITAEGGVES